MYGDQICILLLRTVKSSFKTHPHTKINVSTFCNGNILNWIPFSETHTENTTHIQEEEKEVRVLSTPCTAGHYSQGCSWEIRLKIQVMELKDNLQYWTILSCHFTLPSDVLNQVIPSQKSNQWLLLFHFWKLYRGWS